MRRIAFGMLAWALFLPPNVAAQDFQTGLIAAASGDYAAALKEWRPLAAAGRADAQYQFGLMHRHGKGVKRDYAQAVSWFRKGAEQGLASSQFALGRMYVQGRGIKKDYAKAVPWFRKAAAQGSAPA